MARHLLPTIVLIVNVKERHSYKAQRARLPRYKRSFAERPGCAALVYRAVIEREEPHTRRFRLGFNMLEFTWHLGDLALTSTSRV